MPASRCGEARCILVKSAGKSAPGILLAALAIAFSPVSQADPGLPGNEQQFVNDLVGVGLNPVSGDRAMVASGYRVCDSLSTGKTRDYVTQTVYGSIGGAHLDQAQVVVDSAIRNLCPANASAPQHTPVLQPGSPGSQPEAPSDPGQRPITNDPPYLMRPKPSPNTPGFYGPN